MSTRAAARTAPAAHRRSLREAGASTVEYLGLMTVVAVVVSSLVVAFVSTPWTDYTRTQICKVLSPGADCSMPLTFGDPTPYERAIAGRYVAMGDSFSSGEGAYDYEDDTETDENGCHRSANAYGAVVARNHPFAGGSSFVACSGARHGDLENPSSHQGEGPQLDALGPDVTFVTMSMGGNDLGFADVLKDCVINGESGLPFLQSCKDKHAKRIDERLPLLQQELLERYRQIQARSPGARVVIVGYPELFVENPSDNYRNLLFAKDQVWMNEQARRLNAALAEAAKQAGVEFVNPTEAFRGHGIGSDDPWFNDITLFGPGGSPVDPGSFHPNAAGQAALAALVEEQLRNP